MERECGGCPLLLQHAAPSSGEVDSIFANRMQMAGITPHDRIGKNSAQALVQEERRRRRSLLLLVFGCLQTKRNSSSLGTPGNKP